MAGATMAAPLNGVLPASSSGDDLLHSDEKIGHQTRHVRSFPSVSEALGESRSTVPGRMKTIWTSFKFIYHLSPKEVDDFMNSYVIYNLDWADTAQMVAVLGPKYQQRVGDCLQAYYGVLNHLCALGDVEKMYIPPLMDGSVSVRDNQLLYEQTIARDMNLRPGINVLDLGCGRGRVAAHLSCLTGASITGLTIDATQVSHALAFNAERGLTGNVFVRADFNDLPLPFADRTFDGAYEIQALSLCRNHPALFAELFRVLKPGARMSILDWVALPAYDPSNREHAGLMRRVKPLIGAVGTPTPESLARDLEAAGFVVLKSENASAGGFQAPLIAKVDVYFRVMRRVILALVASRLLPRHFKALINRFCLGGDAFTSMDQMGLATTTWSVIAHKPAL